MKDKVTIQEMYEIIDKLINNKECGIGIHSVGKSKFEMTKEQMLEGMCENGIRIEDGNTILSTVSSLGVCNSVNTQQKRNLREYTFGNESGQYNVLIAVPTELISGNQKMYLGFPDINTLASGNQYKTTCILDYLCCQGNKEGVIPKEFILGYYIDENYDSQNPSKEDKTLKFVKNQKHYFSLTPDEQLAFFEQMQERLNGVYKEISDAVISNDLKKINELASKEQERHDQKVQSKKLELLENGLVNAELAESLAEARAETPARNAQSYLKEKLIYSISKKSIGTKRKILFLEGEIGKTTVNTSTEMKDNAKLQVYEDITREEGKQK